MAAEKPKKEIPFFFIMGRPRSGTTLLSTLFDAHPNVKIPPEYPIFLFMYQKFRKVKYWDETIIRSLADHIFVNSTFNNRDLGNLKFDKETLVARLMEMQGPGKIQDFLKKINELAFSIFPKEEILQVGDKNPIYSLYTKRFLKMFPDARFICITRDYRDNYLSMLKLADLKLEAPILSLQVARWRYVSRIFLDCKKKHPDQFRIIRYEDLVTNQEPVMEELCSFLEIPYLSSIFEFYTKKEESMKIYPKELIERFHQSLMNPVNTGRMNLWKKQLTEHQVLIADQVAGKTADIMGYERVYPGFDLKTFLKTRPMVIYCSIIFRLMILGSYLPYNLTRWFTVRLLLLVRSWHYFFGNKAQN